jgi:heme-degrading monooxygenase HmoA
MYAHVNIWRLAEAGASTDDTASREIGTELSKQPGFRSYTLVRSGPREVVAVSVFDDRDHLERAMAEVAHFVRERVSALVEGEPERRMGYVLFHTSA